MFLSRYLASLTLSHFDSNRPGHDYVGTVHVKQIYEIAKIKHTEEHMKHLDLENLCRVIAGSALSMGIKVVSDTSEIK